MNYLGDYAEDSTVRIFFTTHTKEGGEVAPSNPFENPDVAIYKNGSATQKATVNGLTMTSPFDGIIGLHLLEIDTNVDTGDVGFWAAGSDHSVVLYPDETVDGETVVKVIGSFSLERAGASLALLKNGNYGLSALETLVDGEISPRTQEVVLTSYHEDVHIFPALKAGAISYILKDMKMDKLVEALHRAAEGEVTLHPRVAARVLMNLRGEDGEAPPMFTDLTDRELEVLKLIANGLSNSQIAETLIISENTVKGHVSNILSKLHLADRTKVAVYAWQQGLVQRESLKSTH